MGDEHLIFETPEARVEQCSGCPIPGYLIVSFKPPCPSFSEVPPDAWRDLFDALFVACRVVEEVVQPERLYVCRFGEEAEEIHFHVFPRTKRLLEEYRERAGRPGEAVSGPLLFDWARETYGEADGPKLSENLRRMRKEASRITK